MEYFALISNDVPVIYDEIGADNGFFVFQEMSTHLVAAITKNNTEKNDEGAVN